MKSCVRCGKEIDVIAKDPNKVFYCKKCSLELLKIDENKIFSDANDEVTFIPTNKLLFVIIPGIFQLQQGLLLKACGYFYSAIFFPVAWFVFMLLFVNTNSVAEYDLEPLKFFSLLVIIQVLFLFMINFKEVRSATNRS